MGPSMASIKVFSDASIACACGCQQTYPARTGLLDKDDGYQSLFMIALMKHNDVRNVWAVVGSGPWFAGDPRDCFASIVAWRSDDQIACALKDESPWHAYPLFAQNVGRILTRDEVLAQPGGKAWVFGTFDQLFLLEPMIKGHFDGHDRAPGT